jgi:class 3 adenylate cyclase
MVCPACGTKLRAAAKFCDECGSPTASSSRSGAEYKLVTVLFADVIRSMEIASALDPERLREIMTELFSRSAVVVRHYGGTVDKFTGDGIMALFGAPVALEDHAFRACLAALGIQEETRRVAAEVERLDGVALNLRIGLNSGQVIAGEIGSSPLSYTAIGEHVGMAQRMESVAPSGGVMLSASTARLVEDAVVLGDSQLVYVKGHSAPLPARRLLSIATDRGRMGRRESTLVGRTGEMSTLVEILQQSIDGNGQVVCVVGHPGIGKSRIAFELASIATSDGIEVFSTYCESHASEVPFLVLARLLRSVFGVGDLENDSARARVGHAFPRRTSRICSCSTTCSAFATSTWPCRI